MPKKLVVADRHGAEELRQRYLDCRDAAEARRWHALWLVKEGRSGVETAALLGVSDWAVCAWVAKYNADPERGLSDHRDRNHGRKLLSAAQEAELARLLETARAPDGGLWTGPKVAQMLGAWLGRRVNDQQAWRTMVRLGFRPKHPRPRHPKADAEAQEAFKGGALPNP
jgi:transposase